MGGRAEAVSEGHLAALAKAHGGLLAGLDEESEALLSFPAKHSASDDASSEFAAFAGSLTAASRSPILLLQGGTEIARRIVARVVP